MGRVRSRFFAQHLAKNQLRPPKSSRNSFIEKILPLSPIGRGSCAEIARNPMKTRSFTREGVGYACQRGSRFGRKQSPRFRRRLREKLLENRLFAGFGLGLFGLTLLALGVLAAEALDAA